jgi:hypothetical protein
MKATVHKCFWAVDNESHIEMHIEVELPKESVLEYLQKQVDGLIDIYHHEPTGRDWIVNDEGILLDLPMNRWAYDQGLGLCGTIVEIHGILP